jgi:uncharacterized protein (DUF433 family)
VPAKVTGSGEKEFILFGIGRFFKNIFQKGYFCIQMRSTMDYKTIITIEPGKRSGQPCIRGLRITVFDVLSYLAAGMSHQEILDDFPMLTEEDILACLAYAAEAERIRLVA